MFEQPKPVPPARGRSRHLPHVAAAVGYLVAAVALTLPAWSDPLHTMIGSGSDGLRMMGFLAWFPYATTHGLNPLHITTTDVPSGINAMWDTTLPLVAYVVWPLRALLGVVATYNLVLVLALALDGLCTYLWLRRHTSHALPAFLAGLLMVAGPYAATRAYAHLNLELFFALPLMFMVFEDIVGEPAVRPFRRGLWLGILAAVQLLCTEEPLALVGSTAAGALLVLLALAPRQVMRRVLLGARAAAGALAGFLILGGIPLAYQFLGPDVVHGAIETRGFFVTDLMNFLVPTTAQAISLGGPMVTATHLGPWTGNPIEWNAYVGVPLLIVFTVALVRWRHNRWLLAVGLTTVAVAILSLGPHLHINGTVRGSPPLPEAVLDSLPVLENIIPSRFALLMDFGLAAALAVFIDHGLRTRRRVQRGLCIVATALVAASMWPATVPSTAVDIPRYFQAGGDVASIPHGTIVVMFPQPEVGPGVTASPSVWQAVANFRFSLVSSAAITQAADGSVSFDSTPDPLRCVADGLQLRGSAQSCSVPPALVLQQLHGLGVGMVIVGPTAHEAEILRYLTALTGQPPTSDEGVYIWSL